MSKSLKYSPRFPNRPHNNARTLPFHDLFLTLFNPLNENKKKPTGPIQARRKQDPRGSFKPAPHEVRRNIIERFISRWRKEVGNDIFPAFRLILPEKDRDRAMYGLKEKAIGKLLVKVMKINKDSEDGYNLLNWKLPGQSSASKMAGDFAGRCFEVISKRPIRTQVGHTTIEEVNLLLDKLSMAGKEESQLPIFDELYSKMNAEELMWLIRIILRQMKVGATERTFFDIWHPDAESLFSISSSLRRVCWELYDPTNRLDGIGRGIALMQCFQPQLAQFQMHSFQKMVDRMRPVEGDSAFWIEEKLDGERMQLHLISDNEIRGGKRFGFWSRKAKEYTYLYGNGLYDENAALTRHIKDAFHEGVQNLILDGEMITWDPEQDAMVPFGTLKTAALSEQRNPFSTGPRPLYRVFDILYLNGKDLTNYTLRDRRLALEASINSIHRRLEIHTYVEAQNAADIEPMLRKVVAEASEGLVLKNPRSPYRLNSRNDDWMKVKPEYMMEFGESLDCVVIGGYYGSGHRGGRLSSFLCGLRVDQNQIRQGASPMKCYSFFKVGGGFSAVDYANVRQHTDGKWKEWDPKKPPMDYVELGGGDLQYERPDVWIKPDESVVLEVKAASVTTTGQFRMGFTLRFPRFKRLRTDKDWTSALSVQSFLDLKRNAETEKESKENDAKAFRIDDGRKKRIRDSRKKAMIVIGIDSPINTPYAGPATKILDRLSFYIMTESLEPVNKTKADVEQIVKANGGKILQTHDATHDIVCIADRRTVKVAAREKANDVDLIRPAWIFDCIRQCETDAGRPRLLLPYEDRHAYHVREDMKSRLHLTTDQYGDSYARDVTVDELVNIFEFMPQKSEHWFHPASFRNDMEERGTELGKLPGFLFERLNVLVLNAENEQMDENPMQHDKHQLESLDRDSKRARDLIRFGGGALTYHMSDQSITHVLIEDISADLRNIRKQLAE